MAERPGVLRAGDRMLFGGGEHQVVGLAGNAVPQGLLDGLPEHVARAARDWERHLIEVLTGVPPDAPDGAAPRPEYDLARPLAERNRPRLPS